MFIYLNRKAQSTAEYVVVLGLVAAVAIAMQAYVKRGLQGRIKDAVDYVDNTGQTNGTGVQFTGDLFDPGYISSNFDTRRQSRERAEMQAGGGITTTTETEASNRTGKQVVNRGTANVE
jgi:hypothetical protein